MKFDGFPGEKTIPSFKLANGVGWLTTHRLIIQQETHNPRLNIMERQDPEMYLLRDFEKAEIKDENLTAHFWNHASTLPSFIRVANVSIVLAIDAYAESSNFS